MLSRADLYEIEENLHAHAACADVPTDWFFPSSHYRDDTYRAALTCATCPVSQQCLSYARTTKVEAGIWGGLHVNGQWRDADVRRRRLLQEAFRWVAKQRFELAVAEPFNGSAQHQSYMRELERNVRDEVRAGSVPDEVSELLSDNDDEPQLIGSRAEEGWEQEMLDMIASISSNQ